MLQATGVPLGGGGENEQIAKDKPFHVRYTIKKIEGEGRNRGVFS